MPSDRDDKMFAFLSVLSLFYAVECHEHLLTWYCLQLWLSKVKALWLPYVRRAFPLITTCFSNTVHLCAK